MVAACSPNGLRTCSRWPPRIPRSRRSWPSSPPASIVRCAFQRTATASLDHVAGQAMTHQGPAQDRVVASPVGLIAGGGVLPFAVADSLLARNITPVFFALKGVCDPVAVARFRHHWIP